MFSDEKMADVDIGSSWLDHIPGMWAGIFLRRWIDVHFRNNLHGDIMTCSKDDSFQVHLLRPPADRGKSPLPPRACVVFLHGGGYLAGAPSQFYVYARAVTQNLNVSAACCDYRNLLTRPQSRIPFDAVDDAHRCVTYLRDNADSLGLDSSRMVLVGASSGGHLAAITALKNPSLGLAGLVLLNPVLDLQFAESWSERKPTPVKLIPWLLNMRYGSEAVDEYSPMSQVKPLPYPTLIAHGTDDRTVPFAEIETFQRKMQDVGNECIVVPFERQEHQFFNWRVSTSNFARCVGLLGKFLASLRETDQPEK
eukprot:gnl/MRDRNA2_/MRDRNA2_61474_c0_seq1.p1 gnl/MRDRNA2_/MRDRNA2_61474_c0~~gnl/MRDRNA2_/MRDRNA2_61474_c0_seq1.p1  ORF type:complete len:309 (+),score=33.85 gnl/MRDRNA2_/MRDRNA2_61474_c0_seq1:74-1000(+)